ncbi:hypothetical protein MKW98_017336 [Papaver atlanticum]|uniref:Uncharacterized protein n=1 Tax=Papaver atlanticum TaxID=357466 RepID=A0AAD4ST23_9MAGN|nr:hypothetical protein MKW98_017336 [Papaver atlanticum]
MQSFVEEIVYANTCVREIVDFWRELRSFEFKNECDTLPTAQNQIPMPVDGVVGGDPAAAECSVGDDDLEDDMKDEIYELQEEIEEALDNIELCTVPPLDAVKIPADKLEALMKKFGVDTVKCGDYPPHLQSFGKEIEFWKVRVR